MDLTNIKPCVECGKYGIKCSPAYFFYTDWNYYCTEKADKRIYGLLVAGEDCFKERDNEV